MNDVTKRFLETYIYLKKNKFVKDQKSFTESVGVKPTTYSEYKTNRANVGAKPLQNLVSKYKINPDWLFFGKGEMFADENTENSISVVSEPEANYEGDIFSQLKQRFTIIERKLSIMQSDIEELKKQIRK